MMKSVSKLTPPQIELAVIWYTTTTLSHRAIGERLGVKGEVVSRAIRTEIEDAAMCHRAAEYERRAGKGKR